MKATLKNYRQAPREVRLVADAIRGKNALEAADMLRALPKRAAGPMRKLVLSAVASAKQAGKDENGLVIETITVDKGMTLHRGMPRAFGRATPIAKESSHVTIALNQRDGITKSQETSTKE